MSFPRKLLSLLLVLLLLPAAALATSPYVVRNTTTGTAYTSLANAVSDASAGDTLELLANVRMSRRLSIPDTASLTLDLGPYTITSSDDYVILCQGSLTLKATTGGVCATDSNSYCVTSYGSSGNVRIESGVYTSPITPLLAMKNATLTVTGGTAESLSDSAVSSFTGATVSIGGSAVLKGNSAKYGTVYIDASALDLSGNARIEGLGGIVLMTTNTPSSLTMTGGSVSAKTSFALATNGNRSSGCTANITGGSLASDTVAVYWPEGKSLAIGGTAQVTGSTAVSLRAGSFTLSGNAVLTGTGAYALVEPMNNRAPSDGSALRVDSQFYTPKTQIDVKLEGGSLVSNQGVALTLYRSDENQQPAAVSLTGASLGGKVSSLMFYSVQDKPVVSFSGSQLNARSAQTTLTLPAQYTGAAAATVSSDGNSLVFYPTLDAAMKQASGEVFVLSDNGLTPETLTDPHVQLVVAPGVQLRAASGKDGYTLVQTRNANGSITYKLSDLSFKPMTPSVTASLSGGKLTATASSLTQNMTFTYQWYRDDAPIPGATAATFTPTQKGSYFVEVQGSVQLSPGSFVLTPFSRSAAVAFDPSPAPTATPPKTGDSTPLALYALLALLALATLTALTTARRRHG